MIREAIVKLVNKENLTYEMAEGAMDEIMGGKADPIQISAFLTAMTMKGETIEEITACANGMRKHGVPMEHDKDVLEIVGTGGDKSNSFNISTTASLVISAGGVAVAKHGNRAASSRSGAADCLEALGVKIDLEPEKNKEVLEKLGICFLFAQKYHMSMKYVAPVRKVLGIRTIFNILGPLTNPAAATTPAAVRKLRREIIFFIIQYPPVGSFSCDRCTKQGASFKAALLCACIHYSLAGRVVQFTNRPYFSGHFPAFYVKATKKPVSFLVIFSFCSLCFIVT